MNEITHLRTTQNWPPRRMHQGQKQLASSQSTCLRVSFDFSIVRSFAVMILCLQINANVACFIEIRVDFFCDTTRTIIHFRRSQIKHDFKSPWLWALNRGISYISFHQLYMFKGIGSVSIRWNIVWNRWKGTLKARFLRVSLTQGTATLILPVPTFIHQGKYLTNEHARCLFIFQIAVYICASNVRKLTLIVDIFNVEMIEKSFVYRALLQM